MTNETVNKKDYAIVIQDMIGKIMADSIESDAVGKKGWIGQKEEISTKIRDAVVKKINHKDVKDKFLDYCNGIKSLLAIYNFGNLSEEDGQRERDKTIIKDGIKNILDHVNVYGFDITPMLDRTTLGEIFGDDDDEKVVPITLAATTVFTTLVYFRRAHKRIKLFTKEELFVDKRDLNQEIVAVISELMYLFYEFAYNVPKKENRFMGWGVTLDRDYTKAVTLSDTYAVIDAISRFADAFTQDGDKRDQEFTDAIDEYAVSEEFIRRDSEAKRACYNELTDRCLNATYKTAFNVYERTKGVYGKSVFYSDTTGKGEDVHYEYVKTTYEQIASSSRSSALFNPLYVAMITMYGYNDKELVIRRFMDSDKLANEYYDKYETTWETDGADNGRIPKLSEYAKTLKYKGNFEKDVKLLLESHGIMSTAYGSETADGEDAWKKYYDIARVFQKYLEKHHPEDLMNIDVYRDYLNATKDAIDQVQIMYRDFDNHQRLGMVDTDYATFTISDMAWDGIDIRGIARLNKANIAVNNLRPILLSSKIMIVRALTKYPQADIKELYNAIKAARYAPIKKKGKNQNQSQERMQEWLWNEDAPDMNSTARHIEAITYDYFDYYDKYELGFSAMQKCREELNNFVSNHAGADGDSIGGQEKSDDASSDFGEFKQLVLEIARQTNDEVRQKYEKNLAAKDEEIAIAKKQAEEAQKKLEKEKEEAQCAAQQQIDELKASYKESFEIGETIRGWIRNEIDSYLSKILSMALINTLNNDNKPQDQFKFDDLQEQVADNGGLIDAEFSEVSSTWADIMNDPEDDETKKEKYNMLFRRAIGLRDILGAASNSLLENDYYWYGLARKKQSAEERSKQIRATYDGQKRQGKLTEE